MHDRISAHLPFVSTFTQLFTQHFLKSKSPQRDFKPALLAKTKQERHRLCYLWLLLKITTIDGLLIAGFLLHKQNKQKVLLWLACLLASTTNISWIKVLNAKTVEYLMHYSPWVNKWVCKSRSRLNQVSPKSLFLCHSTMGLPLVFRMKGEANPANPFFHVPT